MRVQLLITSQEQKDATNRHTRRCSKALPKGSPAIFPDCFSFFLLLLLFFHFRRFSGGLCFIIIILLSFDFRYSVQCPVPSAMPERTVRSIRTGRGDVMQHGYKLCCRCSRRKCELFFNDLKVEALTNTWRQKRCSHTTCFRIGGERKTL